MICLTRIILFNICSSLCLPLYLPCSPLPSLLCFPRAAGRRGRVVLGCIPHVGELPGKLHGLRSHPLQGCGAFVLETFAIYRESSRCSSLKRTDSLCRRLYSTRSDHLSPTRARTLRIGQSMNNASLTSLLVCSFFSFIICLRG